MKAGSVDSSGRPAPVATGESYEIPCDTLVIAVGERVDASGLEAVGAALAKDGRVARRSLQPRARPTPSSSRPATRSRVPPPPPRRWARPRPPSAAHRRRPDGRRDGCDGRGRDSARFEGLFRRFEYAMEVPLSPAKAKMNRAQQLPPDERRGNFVEIIAGLHGRAGALRGGALPPLRRPRAHEAALGIAERGAQERGRREGSPGREKDGRGPSRKGRSS